MIDLELRRQVAEALGWTNVSECQKMAKGCKPYLRGRDPIDGCLREIPSYESDIAAAWELLEEPETYYVSNLNSGTAAALLADNFACVAREAQTAPRAICLAYLAWKADKKNNQTPG